MFNFIKKSYLQLSMLSMVAAVSGVSADPTTLPRVSFEYIDNAYIGAFRTNGGAYGPGMIAYNPDNDSVYVTSSNHHFGIGEYKVPELVNTRTDLSALNTTVKLQNSASMLSRIPISSWSREPIENRIMGMYYKDGKLLVNGAIYYDGSGTDQDTTFIIENPNDLAGSAITGNFSTQGLQHTTSWFTELPAEWQAHLGYSHIAGAGLGLAILNRLSVGPSMFGVNFRDYLSANSGDWISTHAYMDFSETNPIQSDFLNFGGTSAGRAQGLSNNDLYTMQSHPYFGFVIPGTRTYAVMGYSAGHTSADTPYQGTKTDTANKNGTIFYKNADASWADSNGVKAGGYRTYWANDKGPFYWLFDMAEITDLSNPWDGRPYETGYYKSLFPKSAAVSGIPAGEGNFSRGGAYDPASGRLYMSWPFADNAGDPAWEGAPVIAVYQFDTSEVPSAPGLPAFLRVVPPPE